MANLIKLIYKSSIHKNYSPSKLEILWKDIEDQKKVNFFLSWDWVSTWIKTYNPDYYLIITTLNDQIFSAGLFTKSLTKRNHFIQSNQFRLLQTGCSAKDQIWIEYSNFIAIKKHTKESLISIIQCLKSELNDWDEIILPNIIYDVSQKITDVEKSASVDMTIDCFSTDYQKLNHDSFISSLSRNSRYQINRSNKIYSQTSGKLKHCIAKTTDQALDWFKQASVFHIARWKDSGFNNQYFMSFHQNLIKRCFITGNIELHKITSGEITIAIIYFFIKDKTAYFYLQGINYTSNQKLKPGLSAHSILIEHFLKQGFKKYDFMGGSSQYKQQLSNATSQITTLTIQNNKMKFKLENFSKKIKQLMT